MRRNGSWRRSTHPNAFVPETVRTLEADEVVPAVDAFVARTLPIVTARLRERYPSMPAELVAQHVNAAAVRLANQARIHDYLSILIERTASESIRRSYA